MTQEEKTMIEAALSSNNPSAAISDACCEILLERVRDRNFTDRTLRYMVEDIIKASRFGFPMKAEIARVTQPQPSKPQTGTSKAAIFAVICLLGIVGAMIGDSALFHAICAAVAAFGAYSVAGALSAKTEFEAPPAPNVKVVCAASAEEIGSTLDKYTKELIALFDYRQLETTHLDFLAWLQKQYCDVDDEVFRASLVRLLKRFGYTLETYADDKADCFSVSESNVTEPVTSVPAVFSPKGKVLLKGHYVMPL